MTRRTLILVEGTRSNGLLYVKAAQCLGLHPITLSADPTQHDYLAAEGLEAIRVDTDNLDALIRECSRLRTSYTIAGITTADELAYATVGKLCRFFSLPGPNPSSIERCCDKFIQRELLKQAGVKMPAYCVTENASDVERAAADLGLPVVLKPAAGVGSIGVRLCRNADELAEHTAYLLGGKHKWRSSPRVLVEEFIQGSQYSVDTMGDEIIAVGAANFAPPPHFVVRESIFPAAVSDRQYHQLADASLSCLRALGLTWGPANIEFRWTKHGPMLIEVNPRLPGWTTPRQVQLAYGIDLVSEHIKLVIGDDWDLRRKHSQNAIARFLVPDVDGTLDWIHGDSVAATVPGVAEVKLYVKPRTPIVRKGDYRDMIGHVIACSPTLAETDATLRRAIDLIDWSITPFSSEPAQSAVWASSGGA
ncbi:ATP-grasp domain-containing protein [Mesorhizobium sp. M1A.F.Ca.ET.072.01.1.1]|uniref:ATP-grasp domain-containing protein n=1 Tax=Mesorhizobium sp. M1A.F.Ca.ET.072.01.1.1 TaxID=2496753 RepID=UPI000FD4D274|nr:acetyl-CoA carboxylase biotin carboxylase subunit family protein [Mesorhizobium sp. M1A.F.Ca.ET.072.01.1.1]RUW54429.1 ATP-grasp domain-containing protein [Mesorhizobium sp. M1A.F.Ca.ET.072.01.1.1]TIV04812.1 MAG: ATP-grasp domain-containing protein [Mesorhizobium sp.]